MNDMQILDHRLSFDKNDLLDGHLVVIRIGKKEVLILYVE